MARVNVNITARDLTGNDMRRIRASFHRLGQDMDRLGTRRTRGNFDRLSRSIGDTRRQLDSMRGAIPDEEFFRMDNAMRRASRTMSRGFNRTSAQQIARIQRDVNRVTQSFQDLNRNGQIRVRVDDSALRRADARLAAWRRTQSVRGVRVPVRADVDRNRFRHGVLGALTSPARAVGGVLGGILSDGLGQGIIGGLQAAGAVMKGALVLVIAGVLAWLGAAVSGILVTALGAAFVSIGVVSAARSKQVKDEWGRTAKVLKDVFTEAGKPFIDVLDRALERTQRIVKYFAPSFQKAMEESVPATEKFIESIQNGFVRFGQNAFKPIMDAWNVFGPIFGKEFEDFMGELGDSFKEMANLVRNHSEEIRIAIRGVFEAIDLLVDAVTFLGKAWVWSLHAAMEVVAQVVEAVGWLVDQTLNGVQIMIEGFSGLISVIPGMKNPLKGAAEAIQDLRDRAKSNFADVAADARRVSSDMDRLNRTRVLRADIDSWNARLATARANLKKTTDQKARAKLQADISDLNAKIAAARRQLANLNGATARTYVTTYYSQVRNQGYAGNSATGGHAYGGIVGAATGGVRSNMTMVGEQGPELVDLPPGSRVRSNPDSRRLVGRGGGGGEVYQINLMLDGRKVAEAVFDPTRKIIRNKGGLARAYGE